VERLFGFFKQEPKRRHASDGIKGIIKDGDDIAGLDADEPVRDAGLISAGQEAEHFEIAAYGTLRTWAQVLGKSEAIQLLDWTLEEEKKAGHTFTQIASRLNFHAAAPRARSRVTTRTKRPAILAEGGLPAPSTTRQCAASGAPSVRRPSLSRGRAVRSA
jgi:Domain of unknown function (DUF892)